MTETRKRIKAYQEALPALRERVAAVALLMVMSLTMMVSASFAWVTLSSAPEVNGVSTTIAANGNLEIALATPDGEAPGPSAVGDSTKTTGSLVESNITWGNLVNLSDPSYGLENIVLRPAQLGVDVYDLLELPLTGSDYGADGRVTETNYDFKFTSWYVPAGTDEGYFQYNEVPQYGVRAISTVFEQIPPGADEMLYDIVGKIPDAHKNVQGKYNGLVDNGTYMSSITDLMSAYLTYRSDGVDGDVTAQVKTLYAMMKDMETNILLPYGDVIMTMVNVQQFKKFGESYTKQGFTNINEVLAASASELADKGISLESIAKYKNLKNAYYAAMGTEATCDSTPNTLLEYYKIATGNPAGTVVWSQIKPVVNQIVHIEECLVTVSGNTVAVKNMGSDFITSNALGFLSGVDATITKGLLYDFEKLTGMYMNKTGLSVSLKGISAKAKSVTTQARKETSYYSTDYAVVSTGGAEAVVYVAEDTYALAVDLWLQTNIADSYLQLEGGLVTDGGKDMPVKGKDYNGSEVNLYSVSINMTDENGEPVTLNETVYKDAEGIWRLQSNHTPLYGEDNATPEEGVTISTPIAKTEVVYTVIDYEGVNRIWSDPKTLPPDASSSTTQGGGSCYVFYAENPAQQESGVKLLANMYVAFIDSTPGSATEGYLVGIAGFDTENYYESAGRVVLPMKLVDNNKNSLTRTPEGELAIYAMRQNTPIRLTALLFLDGEELTNAEVNAVSEIQGRLNIQFGTSTPMEAMEDLELKDEARTVSAKAKKTVDGTYATSSLETPIQFAEDHSGPMSVDVAVTVNGEQPTNMTAFFMRRVNEHQGSRQQSFILTDSDGDGVWTGTYEFTTPGNYMLQTIQFDGTDVELKKDDWIYVAVPGFAVSNVTVDIAEGKAYKTIMTGESIVSSNVSLTFASDKNIAQVVQLQFEREEDHSYVTAKMVRSGDQNWKGSARFMSSGHYVLKYVICDGEYSELPADKQVTLEIVSGMRVKITDTGIYNKVTFGKDGESFTIPIFLEILDDTNNPVKELEKVKLVYSNGNSELQGMDPDMIWTVTEEKSYYYGEMLMADVGIFQFKHVKIGETNVLTKTTEAPPTFSCLSPDPPFYYDAKPMNDMESYIMDSGVSQNIQLGLRIGHARAAKASVRLYNADTGELTDWTEFKGRNDDENIMIDGENVPVSTFLFDVPEKNGYQSGTWTIKELRLIDVFDKDGNGYYEENPMMISLEDQNIPSIKIVNVVIKLESEPETLPSNLTFLQSYTSQNPITLSIKDQNGEPMEYTVSDMKLYYRYQGNSYEHGGYSSSVTGENKGLTPGSTTVLVENAVYEFNNIHMAYAGTYEPYTLYFTLKDSDGNVKQVFSYDQTTGNMPVGMPTYVLKTAKPTVKITGVTPLNAHAADNSADGGGISDPSTTTGSGCNKKTTYSVNSNHGSATSAIASDGYSATVYFKCFHPGSYSDNTSQLYHYYFDNSHDGLPQVTIKLEGLGSNFTSAKLDFDNSTYIYSEGPAYTSSGLNGIWEMTDGGQSFTWTGDGTSVTRYIGYCRTQVSRSSDAANADSQKTPAGTITAPTMTVEYNGTSYTFDIPDIIINNPY